MTSYVEDIDSDNGSISDVLLCWGSEGDDDDESLAMISKVSDEDIMPLELIPISPKRSESPPPNFVPKNAELCRLMKKYPDFVPARLPSAPRKRSRPVCLFINYMGTRQPEAPLPKPKPVMVKSVVMEHSPYPTELPSYQARPDKRQKVNPFPQAGPTGFLKGSKNLLVSPEPTLCPSSATTRAAPRV